MRLDALPGDATGFDELRLDVCLHLQSLPPLLRVFGERFENSLAPGDVRLSHRRQLAQETDRRCVCQRVGGVGVVNVAAHQMRLEHAVDRCQASDRVIEFPDRFTQAGELVCARFLAIARGA